MRYQPTDRDHYRAGCAVSASMVNYSEAKARGVPHYANSTGVLDDDVESVRYRAFLAEIAVATVIGQPWNGGWGQNGETVVDVGTNIEVRNMRSIHDGPLVYAKDINDSRLEWLVGCYVDLDHVLIHGYINIHQAYELRQCAEATMNRCCRYYANTGNVRVNLRHLRPIIEFMEEQ